MPDLSHIKGVLFDLDGVLYVGPQVIEGAREAIDAVRGAGYRCRFVTNTSTMSMASLRKKLAALGFDVPAHELISAPQATILYLRGLDKPRCRLLLADDVKQDFAEFVSDESHPDVVIVGDIGQTWSYALLDSVFNNLLQGARLIAVHKNRFWQTEHGLKMDIGGFIAALEYASGVETMIIGKPSLDFFNVALADMQLEPAEVLMVGDDIDSDVGGAQQAGIRAALVRTGKYRAAYCESSAIKPDLILDSVADLPAALQRERAINT